MHRATVMITVAALVACADGSESGTATSEAARAAPDAPTILVYKTATCGCCNGWIDHLAAAGYTVDARDTRDLVSIKRDAGVPAGLVTCHTAIVDGYVIEGHVPIEQVTRLLAERPEVAGIGVPGMPIGSPGMEGRNPEPYQVFSFDHSGHTEVYAEIDPR